MDSHAPEPGPAISALALLGDAPAMSIEQLRRILGLSHPGAVHLVDRLAAEGLVRRQPSKNDWRAVEVHLTEVGRKSSTAILRARRRWMAAALQHLEPFERVAFGKLTKKMLVQFIKSIEDACSICRLCDHNSCIDCPVNKALFQEGTDRQHSGRTVTSIRRLDVRGRSMRLKSPVNSAVLGETVNIRLLSALSGIYLRNELLA